MSGTDQTSITYVRPGEWQPSAAMIPGIDARHTFANQGINDPEGPPLGLPQGGPSDPDSATARIDTRGPSAGGFHAPPQNDRKWWRRRNASQVNLDTVGDGSEWEFTADLPQVDTEKPRDPRNAPIPVDRWTGRTGPVLMAFLNRTFAARDMRHASRFNPNPGTNFAFTPSLRPSPAALGDGNGFRRFRTTQRLSPAPLDQVIVSHDQSDSTPGTVLGNGGQLSQRWW